MILYFAIFLFTIAFVSRVGYIGDINSLKSYVTVVGGRLCSVDYFCFFARLRSSVTQLLKKPLKYHSDTKIHVFSNNSKNQTAFPSPIIILYMSDSDRGCGCRWYGAKSFEGSAAAFSASFCRFIFLWLRFTSAMMPVWSNSLMAMRSISF